MTARPKVSVIIPTHNHAHFLPECLSSVRAQTYTDYEVIVVNNGSTDDTESLIGKLTWDKLRYYFQNDTGSVAGPRNTGIRLARGKYVAFLDSDDLWYEKKLERVMKVLENSPDIDILSHDLFLVRNERPKTILKSGPLKKDMFKFILIKNPLLGSATVVKKSAMIEIGGFDGRRDFIHAEDSDAWLKIAYLGKKFYFINEALGEYRVHDNNLSRDFKSVLLNEKNVIVNHFDNLKSKIPLHGYLIYRNRLCRIYFNMGVQYFFRKKLIIGLFNIAKAFYLNPFVFLATLVHFFLKM